MLKVPLTGQCCEFWRCKAKSVISDYGSDTPYLLRGHWTSNQSFGVFRRERIHLTEVTKVVPHNQKDPAWEIVEVSGPLGPRKWRNIVLSYGFPDLRVVVSLANIILTNEVFHLWAHPRPEHAFLQTTKATTKANVTWILMSQVHNSVSQGTGKQTDESLEKSSSFGQSVLYGTVPVWTGRRRGQTSRMTPLRDLQTSSWEDCFWICSGRDGVIGKVSIWSTSSRDFTSSQDAVSLRYAGLRVSAI